MVSIPIASLIYQLISKIWIEKMVYNEQGNSEEAEKVSQMKRKEKRQLNVIITKCGTLIREVNKQKEL